MSILINLICPYCEAKIKRDRGEDLTIGKWLRRGKAKSYYDHYCTSCGKTIPAGQWVNVE